MTSSSSTRNFTSLSFPPPLFLPRHNHFPPSNSLPKTHHKPSLNTLVSSPRVPPKRTLSVSFVFFSFLLLRLNLWLFKGRFDRGFRRWQIQPTVQIYQKRVQPRNVRRKRERGLFFPPLLLFLLFVDAMKTIGNQPLEWNLQLGQLRPVKAGVSFFFFPFFFG